ncbi:hypothetical protein C0992_000303 [Termitomyces sp. T32_za158]|nr:hypothetical protein C0992_000303 [Termitomyces sp. T32_za158]
MPVARGTHASPPLSSLPKVSFTKLDDDVSTQPGGVHDSQARAFGYNDFSEFQRPDSYIRHIEPLESELAKQVEYDMDEQDKEWLDALNRERRKEQMSQISYELFEVVMDRLEKEWFDLIAMASRIFLRASGFAVNAQSHQKTQSLCPNEGGAFKQTVSGEWVHLLCAIWVPETRVANEVFMEPVTGIDKISKQRWKLVGACIQCSKASCVLAFHATCARRDRLLMPMKAAHGAEPVTLACYCDRHLPKEQQEVRAAALAMDEQLQDSPSHNAKLAKSARAYAKTYKPGPPLVPAVVVDRIDYYVRRFKVTKRVPTIQMMCRYWSLKREARRGAPLLKRLHLEPWTASAGGKAQTDEEKVMKLDQLNHLLYDMEGLKDLTFSTKKRERWKLEQIRALCNVLDNSLFVHERRLRAALERIMKQEYFKNPVSRAEVPDYFDVIQNPMCWVMIEAKLDKHEYWDVDTFKRDIDLVVDNAILYNKPGTPFHKAALRMQNAVSPITQELRQSENLAKYSETDPANTIGDLEPPLEFLELLLSPESIQSDMDLQLDDTPLASLFSYALPKLKPPPPPPPPPTPPPPRQLKKRGRKPKKKAGDAVDGDAITSHVDVTQLAMGVDAAEDSSTLVSTGAHAEEFPVVEPTEQHVGGIAEPSGRSRKKSTQRLPEKLLEQRLPPSTSAVYSSASPSKRDRVSRQSRSKNDALPLVDDVNNHQSFKMFNEGWILPPEQKRGGRVSVDRQNVVVTPRPRKRMRTGMIFAFVLFETDSGPDAGPSRLSVVSTAATEAQTVPGTPPVLDASADVPPPALAGASTSVHSAAKVHPETFGQETSRLTKAAVFQAQREPEISGQTEEGLQQSQAEQPQSPQLSEKPLETETTSQRVSEKEDIGRSRSLSLSSLASYTPDASVLATNDVTAEVSLLKEPSPKSRTEAVPGTGRRSVDRQESISSLDTCLSDVEESPYPETETMSGNQDIPPSGFQLLRPPESAIRFDIPDTRSVNPQGPLPVVTHHIINIPSAPVSIPVSQKPRAEHPHEAFEPPEVYDYEDTEITEDDGDDDVMEVDLPRGELAFVPVSASRPRRRPSSPTIRRLSVSDAPPLSATETERVVEENGRRVLETLDTPELRRKKATERRKQLEEKKKQQQQVVLPADGEHTNTLAGEGSRVRLAQESGSLSEVGSEARAIASVSVSGPRKRGRGRPSLAQEIVAEPEHVLIKPGQVLDGGTIVWAQARSFPWWPAVIWDENHPEVPLNIRAEYAKAKRRFGPDVHIVQFFDKHRSWQLLPNDSLRMLAEDKELDQDMIADKSKRQKTKWTPKNIQECRVSYGIALQEMETVSDLENAAVISANVAAVTAPPAVGAEEGVTLPME